MSASPLPLQGAPCADGAVAPPPQSQPPAEPARVLVVDDQPANLRALREALGDDYRVLAATGGEQALVLCQQQLPDLVLLDVVMSGLDGHAVCRRLKADPRTRAIPVIFVSGRSSPQEEADGLELGAVDFIGKPISPAVVRARVRTHLALARSNAEMAATLEATADGILVTDNTGAPTSFSRRFAGLWRLPAHWCPPDDGPRIGQWLRNALAPHQPDPLHADRFDASDASAHALPVYALRDGRFVRRHVAPLRLNGRIDGRVYGFRDVTRRVLAARELADLNAHLERRIVDRTRELDEARMAAESANRAKSDFLSNVSHEIRTPMNSILGMTQLALRRDAPPAIRGYLEKIDISGRLLLGVVDDVLDLSKIEAGKFELSPVDFRMGDLMRDVTEQMSLRAAAKGLELAADIDPQIARYQHGDALRLQQVLVNFIGNAIKFSEGGRITVRARSVERTPAGNLVRFEVEDQGIGMTAEQLSRLFQPFEQADASISRRYGGSGLGLAICKRLAQMMGGEVGARSQPHVGSCFWFTALLGWCGAVDDSPSPTLPDADAAAIEGRRILVVDDNAFNREVARDLLELAGARVLLAADGEEALAAMQAAAEPVELVLMDMQMPVVDGLQATRRIRATPALAHTPVLGFTANARREDMDRCTESGMNAALVKPVVPEKLYAMVARHLPPRAHPSPAPSATAPLPQVPADAVPTAPAALACDPQVIDLSMLEASVRQPDKVRKYAFMFIDSMSMTLQEMQQALERGDLTALADLGHRAKSSAATVGAMGIRQLCQQLQQLQHDGTVAQARELVAAIAPLLSRVKTSIETAFAPDKGST